MTSPHANANANVPHLPLLGTGPSDREKSSLRPRMQPFSERSARTEATPTFSFQTAVGGGGETTAGGVPPPSGSPLRATSPASWCCGDLSSPPPGGTLSPALLSPPPPPSPRRSASAPPSVKAVRKRTGSPEPEGRPFPSAAGPATTSVFSELLAPMRVHERLKIPRLDREDCTIGASQHVAALQIALVHGAVRRRSENIGVRCA